MRTKRVAPTRQEPAWEEWVSSIPTLGRTMHETVAKRAYSYWEARGFQGGSAEEDWLRAEAEIQLERSANAIINLDRTNLQ